MSEFTAGTLVIVGLVALVMGLGWAADQYWQGYECPAGTSLVHTRSGTVCAIKPVRRP